MQLAVSAVRCGREVLKPVNLHSRGRSELSLQLRHWRLCIPSAKLLNYPQTYQLPTEPMSSNFGIARRAEPKDLKRMYELPSSPGLTSIGPRSLAFCHPNHSRETLACYFETFPQGIFVSEYDGGIVGFACAIRAPGNVVDEPNTWSDPTVNRALLSHQEGGEWLYVSRLTYTAGPGHAHLSNEVGPLLAALQGLAKQLDLSGVAVALRFPGYRERSGTTPFQRACIDDQHNQVRSGLNPIGVAYYQGFRHHLALPNYLGDGQHFALMVWNRLSD